MHAMATLTAVLLREGKFVVARCAELGTVSQGKTVEEALANLKEATELFLEEFPERLPRGNHPIVTTFEVAGDAAA